MTPLWVVDVTESPRFARRTREGGRRLDDDNGDEKRSPVAKNAA
jgi:hypothetical protein